jgi:hypothetical protein
MEFKQLKRYILSVYKRVLPNITYDFSSYYYLYSDKDIRSYFKGIRVINEYPGLYQIFKNRGFDMSLADKVRKTRKRSKDIFFENISMLLKLSSNPSTRFEVKLDDGVLDFLTYRFKIDFLGGGDLPTFEYPSWEQVLYAVNKTASSGLPNPFIKKRDFIHDFHSIYNSILSGKFKHSDVFRFPAAAFLRSQIRLSDLKIRIVNAVEKYQGFVESIYYNWFMNGYKKIQQKSCICIGLTQHEISEVVQQYKHLNTYSIDYKKWDLKRPQIISIISFCVLEYCLPVNNYHLKILRSLRNYYLTMPIFHPQFELIRRHRGTISGSGFTSLDNSICNWVLTTMSVYFYCKQKGIDPYSINYKLSILGDDLLIGFNDLILDFSSLVKIIKKRFDMDIELEMDMSESGSDICFFLGSKMGIWCSY